MKLTWEQMEQLHGVGIDLDTILKIHATDGEQEQEREQEREQEQEQEQEQPAPASLKQEQPANAELLTAIKQELQNLTAAMQANAILNTHAETGTLNTIDKLSDILAGNK